MLLKEKVAVVTGAAQGIGLAIARTFTEHGARVVVADLSEEGAAGAARELGDSAWGIACDVSDEDSVRAAFSGAVDRYGRVDVLVNNAGITRDGMMHRMSVEDFRFVVDVHLQGTWLCSREALLHMRSREGGGSIVNLSSISGKVGNLGQSNYAAAKAGVIGMTKSVAREGARFGVRVNAIQPGLIRTAMTAAMPKDVLAASLESVPLGRPGEPVEVASSALFLASDLASYVTGVTLEVAGGRHM
ncbi:3-oxoacyl-ACP reductase FabG [Saccharomonospora sp. NPDC046836]|uniref:3-oxoacyl-ACP reductase FabG n=1 Tax=Saccharomonospora sp. NPDC046836 TaxID=3156921 RepID=UPI0033C46E39